MNSTDLTCGSGRGGLAVHLNGGRPGKLPLGRPCTAHTICSGSGFRVGVLATLWVVVSSFFGRVAPGQLFPACAASAAARPLTDGAWVFLHRVSSARERILRQGVQPSKVSTSARLRARGHVNAYLEAISPESVQPFRGVNVGWHLQNKTKGIVCK